MKIRVVSDLHLEFEEKISKEHKFRMPTLPDDKDTVLILAGDIGVIKRQSSILPLIEQVTQQFKQVIYVFGNHEFYGSSLIRARDKFADYAAHTGVKILQNDRIDIDGISFLGATLWTDYNKGNPIDMYTAETSLSDFRTIRTGFLKEPYRRKIKGTDMYTSHMDSKEYIFKEMTKIKEATDNKIVVISHHAPSYQSVAPYFQGDMLNSAYTSELAYDIMDNGPDLWVHGHMHNTSSYSIGDTQVIANPRGYVGHDLNCEFDPSLTIDL